MTTTSKINNESIVKQWTSFDLKSMQHDLNVTTTEIVSCADESDQSRRKLVELSRDFKKKTNEDVRKPITPILKSFQIEIDSLSKQSKLPEEIFLKTYQNNLSELSDPVPILEFTQALERRLENITDLEIKNQNFKEILDELAHVKSQELTIKQLRDKIKDLEEKTEVIIKQHIKDKEDFQHIFADKEHQFDLIQKYAQMEMHQSVLDPIHQDMFDYKLKQDDTTNLFSTNNQDLAQMNKQTSNTERYLCEDFEKKRVTNNISDELISQEEIERKLCEKLELELAAKERQIVTLVDETQKLQSTLIKMKETSLTQISDLENVLSEKEKLIAQLENKLQSQADYDEIKRELTVLKSIDFSTKNRSNDDQTENLSKKSFEPLSLEKDRSIKDEQTQIKMSQIDSESNINHYQLQYPCRHCTSPCLHRSNTPYVPVPPFLSSSTSSSSNSSSSPSSPSQIYLKTHQQSTTICNGMDESLKKLMPSIPSLITTKDNLSLCNPLSNSTNTKYPSLTTSCSTMVTPTASLLSSVTTTTLTPSNLFPGHQLSSVQCTKLHCPPTSSWSPPLSSSSGVSSIATTSTDNRTVIKSTKQTSPKSLPSPTTIAPSTSLSSSSTTATATTTTTTATLNNTSLLEPLDTTYVANVVRKLLAQHNIGQRIFARYILSLSQGTVSELLSKPKSWAKLTEKGKESYRKMWCWANSEESILTLKSISPRKGMNNRSKDNPYPAISTKHTDPATHQKIVQILADAQKQQIAAAVAAAAAASGDQKNLLSPCSSLPNDPSNVNLSIDHLESKASSPSSNSSSASSSPMNSPSNPSIPSDQQTCLLPVAPPPPPPSCSTTTSSLSMLSAFVPSLLMRTANSFNTETTTNNLLDCSTSSPFSLLHHQPDNYRNWLMLQEIFRNNDLMKQFQPSSNGNDDESDQDNDDDNNDDDDDGDNDGDDDDNNHNDDENSNDDDDDDMQDENPTSSDEIPLDLSMKIDSNPHNMERTSMKISNHKQAISTKHSKTALAPLREQDTSKYRYINTLELVQTVKDILSRYSISQRHFGEKILGLSQGSVSDILARPKQWELLTQKGREPFLRMRLFLDDPNAIKQLVPTVTTTSTILPSASSSSSLSTTTTNSILLPTFCPPSIIPSSSILANNPSLNGYHPNKLFPRDNSTDSQSNILLNDSSQLLTNEAIQLPLLPPPPPPTSSSSAPLNGLGTNSNKSKSRSKTPKGNHDKPVANPNRHSTANPLMAAYELPKIQMPSSIDTEQLSSQVRELLFAYSIGQRVFGEAVLNLSQGTVSEILSKPRPWHSLSVKGREPYMRMYTWYHDTGNVQKLLAWKRERDALRRSRPPATINNNGDMEGTNNNSTLKRSSSSTNNNNNNPKRRYLFTDDQRRALKQIFENEPYPSQSTLEQLVGELSLPMNKIANWFHNSRMRAKTNIHSSSSSLNKLSTTSINNDDLISTQSDDDDDLDNNNNNNTNNNNDEDDDDEDDDYPIPTTIVPLTSSWLNGTNDSNSSTSPIGLSATSTNIVSLIDDHKPMPISSLASSSSKKRKSVPQKIVTTNNNNNNTNSTKKFHNDSNLIENDSNDETNQKTNESTSLVDILT